MGAAAIPIAVGASIASAGFGAAGSIAEGRAGKAAAEAKGAEATFAAQRAERAAEFGRVQADQTDVALREELATTIANIDAISAASNVDPLSPTRMAIKDRETEVSDRQRTSKVASIKLQAAEDERMAGYSHSVATYQKAVGKSALRAGYINAAAKITGGIAQGARGAA